jgi:hypothetical protein
MVLVITLSFVMAHSVNRFDLLLQEEVILAQEISAFNKKLESWSTATFSKQPACVSGVLVRQQHKPDADRTPSAVLAFEVSILSVMCTVYNNIFMDLCMFGLNDNCYRDSCCYVCI